MKKLTAICILLLFSGLLNRSFSQTVSTRLVEKVEKRGKDISIPFEKYVLANGLTLIVHEDHSDPIVHVDVTYHVGSAREEIGKSGFAHFFEHMMFQGSDHVGDDQHFKIVSEAGGTLNGTTNTDRTNYFETMPSNQLEVALWLESDRMGFLLDAVTQTKFENQRSTVKNERGQNYDNRPYGLVNEKIWQALYPYGHPYSWLTIGYIEDLNRSDVNDLKKFFLRWYGPNNATLTVAGDVKTTDVVKLAEKYFGSIPKCPDVKPMEKSYLKLDADRYISYEDNIRMPMIALSFPTVPSNDPDEAPLDILADIIGGGKNSIMYRDFVKTKRAYRAAANNGTQELAGIFEVSIRMFPDQTSNNMEQMARQAFSEFERTGCTDEDLERFKATYEANLINSLESVRGKASRLASYQTFTGNPDYIKKEYQAYMNVKKEDVMRVYNKYIKGQHAVILSVYPKGHPEIVPQKDNFTPPTSGTVLNKTDYAGLEYHKAKDTFDRSKKPEPGPAPMLHVPPVWKETFPNGMKVMGSANSEIPSVSILITIDGGHTCEASNPAKAGLSALTASMMNESSEKFNSEEFSSNLQKLGSSISVRSDQQAVSVSISSLVKNMDATLALVEERLFHPKFDAEDFARVKKQQLESIGDQVTQAPIIATNVYLKLLYGNNHIFSIPRLGTAESVNNITLDDVKDFYSKYFSPSVSNLVIVGDVEQKVILAKLNFLKNWNPKQVLIPLLPAAPQIEKTRIYLVNKEKAPQSEIRIGYISIPFDATGEYYKANLMNFTLGGAFNSRINMNLREDKGWTYGARSFFSGDKSPGPYTASAGVRANATDSAVYEFMSEIKKYRESGITADELLFTKKSIGQRDALKYETQSQKAFFLKDMLDYNLSADFTNQQNKILQEITKADIDALAKKHLPYENMSIVVVGDSKKIRDGLVKLGYDVIDLDVNGNKLK